MLFKCLNTSNKENIITIQGAKATDSSNPFASIRFQNFDVDTQQRYDMVSIACLDHFGDTSNNGFGDIVIKTAGSNLLGGTSNLQEQMRVMYNGNVLIGANASRNFKLSIDGSVYATGFCNLLLNSSSNTSIHHAPTCSALSVVNDISTSTSNIATWSSNIISQNLSSIAWSSNTTYFSSNIAVFASNAVMFQSNAVFISLWASNTSIPFASNAASWASNTIPWLSNTTVENTTKTIWASNTSEFASNASVWSCNAAMFSSNVVLTAYWLSNYGVPWTSNTAIYASNESTFASNLSTSNSNYTYPILSNTLFIATYASNQVNNNSNFLYPTSIFSSNVSFWTSNLAQTTSNFAYLNIINTSNIATFASNLATSTSNYVYPISANTFDIATFASNLCVNTSNSLYPTTLYSSNSTTFASNTTLYASNLATSTSNYIYPISANTFDIATYASNIGVSTSNLAISTSNFLYPTLTSTSGTAVFSSNLVISNSNFLYPTVNYTSNTAVFASNNTYWRSNHSNIFIFSNIGINTSNPSSTLTVIGTTLFSNALSTYNGTATFNNNVIILSNLAINTQTPSERLDVQGNTKIGCNLYVMSNVGIGTSNPIFNLHVAGSMLTSNIITNNLQVLASSTNPMNNVISLRSLNPTLLDASDSSNAGVFAGGPPAIFDSNADAWRFINDSNTKKISWYFFGNSNSNNIAFRYKNLRTFYYRIRFNGSNVPVSDFYPQLNMYSLPLSDGSNAQVWYRSRMNYFTYTDSNCQVGKDYIFYVNEDPASAGFLNLVSEKRIKVHFSSNQFSAFAGPSNEGRILDNHILQYLVLSTTSSAPINTVDFTLTEIGYRFGPTFTRYITYFTSN